MYDKNLIKEFLEGGWLISIIGASAMIARLLTTHTRDTVFQQLKKIFAAAIASSIAWFILEQTDVPSLYKAISYGIVGVIAPEIIQGIISLGKKFSKNPGDIIHKR